MKFLIDECLPRRIVAVITQKGHDALWVRESPLVGLPDDHILRYAKQHGYLVVTRDLDFGNLLDYPPSMHCGVIVLRLPSERRAEQIAACVSVFLDDVNMSSLKNALTIVEETRYRIRQLRK